MKEYKSPWEAYSVAVEMISAGQPRPYADSRYEARLTFTSQSDPGYAFEKISEDIVSRVAYGLVREHCHRKPKDKREWHESYLDVARQEKPGVWFVRIVQPYTD